MRYIMWSVFLRIGYSFVLIMGLSFVTYGADDIDWTIVSEETCEFAEGPVIGSVWCGLFL